MSSMKEARVNPDISVTFHDVPIPKPGPGEVMIKVVIAGSNPKDWKYPAWMKKTMNAGDDAAGTIVSVGEGVLGFHEGDRVAGFHVMHAPYGTFAEYAVIPAATTWHLPDHTSFEEAATIPLAAYTAVVALFHLFELPAPWDLVAIEDATKDTKRPLVIYGASTAVGAFAIKLAAKAGVHPIIAVGSKNSEFVTNKYLDASKGDKLVDYTQHKDPDALVEAIKQALGGQQVYYVLDAITDAATTVALTKLAAGPPHPVTGRKPQVATVLDAPDEAKQDDRVNVDKIMVWTVHMEKEGQKLLGLVWGQLFQDGLQKGWLEGHPYEVIQGGLGGLEGALKGLKDGSIRAKKALFRVEETEGLARK